MRTTDLGNTAPGPASAPSSHRAVAIRLDEILAVPATQELVRIYFGTSPASAEFPSFAGNLFDDFRQGPPDEFDAADLFALNLLDEMAGAEAARQIVAAGVANDALGALPEDLDLWDADATVMADVHQLWKVLLTVPSVGPTKASKLMARKRPRLVPIWDSVVQRELSPRRGEWWGALAAALSDRERLRRVRALDPRLRGYEPSALRLVDVAVWMTGSESTAARSARMSVTRRVR